MAKTRSIGLDIGTTAVRAVEVEFGSAGPSQGVTIHHAAEVPLPLGAVRDAEVVEPETVATALKQLWQTGRFTDKEVFIGVGNQRVLVRDLDLPWLPMPQLRQSLPYQTQELLPVSSEDALLDYYPTGEYLSETGRTLQGIFVAAVKDTVVANVLAVEGAGLSPHAVDLNAFAVLRSLARGALAERTIAFLDIGARVTNLVVAERAIPRFVRTLATGGLDVTDAVASAVQVTAADAERIKREVGVGFQVPAELAPAAEATGRVSRTLVEALRSSLVYYGQQWPDAPVEGLVLSGGGALLPGLGQYASSATRLPAQLGNPLDGMALGKGAPADLFRGREYLWAVAFGLAYGAAA